MGLFTMNRGRFFGSSTNYLANITRNCDELPESSQRAPRELPESSHLQALVKYVSR